jgi:hypothetical protein
MKKLKFVRYGGLSPVKQDQYTTGDDKTFHNPPRRKGIYAFPYPYVEKFLLGATNYPGHVSNKAKWLKDENGNKIIDGDFYKGYDKKTDRFIINKKYITLLKKLKIKQSDIGCQEHNELFYVTVYNKPRIFDYDGEIWHHLTDKIKPHQIIELNGSWVKSTMDDYLLALQLDIRDTKRYMLKTVKEWDGDISKYLTKNPYKNFNTKDHLEVFIEKIK